MAEPAPEDAPLPRSELTPEVKAARSASFGGVADAYERFRPGPPLAAVDWFLPGPVGRVVDLGAGTGALTRLLVGRADDVVAVEPDDRMRAVLVERVSGVRAVEGRGEAMPLEDGTVDAVLASTSWHWVEPVAGLQEVARVLVPGGTLGAVWSGPDPDGAFLAQARALLAGQSDPGVVAEVMDTAVHNPSRLDIPEGLPFETPEQQTFRWDVGLTADDLIGLLSTFSWVITMPEGQQTALKA